MIALDHMNLRKNATSPHAPLLLDGTIRAADIVVKVKPDARPEFYDMRDGALAQVLPNKQTRPLFLWRGRSARVICKRRP